MPLKHSRTFNMLFKLSSSSSKRFWTFLKHSKIFCLLLKQFKSVSNLNSKKVKNLAYLKKFWAFSQIFMFFLIKIYFVKRLFFTILVLFNLDRNYVTILYLFECSAEISQRELSINCQSYSHWLTWLVNVVRLFFEFLGNKAKTFINCFPIVDIRGTLLQIV